MKKRSPKKEEERYRSILSGIDINPDEENFEIEETAKAPPIDAKQIYAALADAQVIVARQNTGVPAKTIPQKSPKNDPFRKQKIGADAIQLHLIRAITEPDGRINAVYLLLLASGLAGLACQKASAETKHDVTEYLVKTRYSVCNLTAGTLHRLHPDLPVPKTGPIAAHVTEHITDPDYHIGEIAMPKYLPRYTQLWQYFQKIIEKCCAKPDDYPILFGLTIQKVLETVDRAADPLFSFRFVVENAIYAANATYPA